MKVTLAGHSFGPLGILLLGLGLIVFAVSLLLPIDISKGVLFIWALLDGLFLILGV